jgi:dienelactone hydrolase
MDVAVVARYPAGAGRALPVVVLCHGLGGEPDSYAELGNYLATHGYAVLHPQFRDALSVAGESLGLTGPDAQHWMHDPDTRARMHTLLFDPEHWLSRVARVHAVLDSLTEQAHLPLRLNPDGVIVAGHSFGAYTAQLLVGTRLAGADAGAAADTDFGHPAVAAAVLMSPQGSGDRGLTPRSWDGVRSPLLVITARRDFGAKGEGLAWRREPFDAARSPIKHLAVVRDGDHFLGGLPTATGGDSAGSSQTRTALAALTVAFAALVHGDRAAGDWLASAPFSELIDHEHQEKP